MQTHIPQTGHVLRAVQPISAGHASTRRRGACGDSDHTQASAAGVSVPGHEPQPVGARGQSHWRASSSTRYPYFLLFGLVVLTGWYQVRQTQARQASQGGAPPNAQMQAITKIMPVFFGLISYGFIAATTIYFVVSNAWRIGQQHFVLNKMYEEERLGQERWPRTSATRQEPRARASRRHRIDRATTCRQNGTRSNRRRNRRRPAQEEAEALTHGLDRGHRAERSTTPRSSRSTGSASSRTSSSSRSSTRPKAGCSASAAPTPGSGPGSSRCRGRSRPIAAGAGKSSIARRPRGGGRIGTKRRRRSARRRRATAEGARARQERRTATRPRAVAARRGGRGGGGGGSNTVPRASKQQAGANGRSSGRRSRWKPSRCRQAEHAAKFTDELVRSMGFQASVRTEIDEDDVDGPCRR